MKPYIVHLTPALANQGKEPSINLGDVIIHLYTSQIIEEVFPQMEIIELATHDFLSEKEIKLIQKAEYTIIGGSNLLSSNIRAYNQWKTYHKTLDFLFPSINNILLLGVGWWQYQENPNLFTKIFYRQVLSKKQIHSVRDTYTQKNLSTIGIINCVNTSCPTTWKLDGLNLSNLSGIHNRCIFSLTDYNPNEEFDNELITILSSLYDELFFFPQGTQDEAYLYSLVSYNNTKNKIKIIGRSLEELNSIIAFKDIDYIGTRLHLGIHCLNNNINSLIISIDNRAKEIQKDINLPCIDRKHQREIYNWHNKDMKINDIILPKKAIKIWKNQFS